MADTIIPFSSWINSDGSVARVESGGGQVAFVDGFERGPPEVVQEVSKFLHKTGPAPHGRWLPNNHPAARIPDAGMAIEEVISFRNTHMAGYGNGLWAMIGFLRAANTPGYYGSMWFDSSPRIIIGVPPNPPGTGLITGGIVDGLVNVVNLPESFLLADFEWVKMRVHVWRNVGGDGNWYAKMTISRYPSDEVVMDSIPYLIWDYNWGALPGRYWQLASGMWDGGQDTFNDRTIIDYPPST